MSAGSTFDDSAAAKPRSKPLGRYTTTAARALFGLIFLVFGLNGFFMFLPKPTGIPEAAFAFIGALMKTGYMFPMIKGIEVIVGVLLLANRFVPLALVLIAPNVINILAFHAFLAPSEIPLALVLLVLELYLAWAYRSAYRSVLAARSVPG